MTINSRINMSMKNTLTDEQIVRFNKLYEKANNMISGLLILDGRTNFKNGFFAKRKLKKAIELLELALKIYPENWQSMFAIAKAHQSLGDLETALTWLQNANQYEPENPSIAKEIGLCAGKLGKHNIAIQYMEAISKLSPNTIGLHVNLGLSYLMLNQLDSAKTSFNQAILVEPNSNTNKRLLALVENVISGKIPCPKSEKEIQKFI